MDQTLITAIRTVGQLLLHHPTTGFYARNSQGEICDYERSDASCFCFLGACHLVQKRLRLSNWCSLVEECGKLLSWGNYHHARWDNATNEQRQAWAQKLADFNG